MNQGVWGGAVDATLIDVWQCCLVQQGPATSMTESKATTMVQQLDRHLACISMLKRFWSFCKQASGVYHPLVVMEEDKHAGHIVVGTA